MAPPTAEELIQVSIPYINFTSKTHQDTYPFISNNRLPGHSVLVTGANRGIGLAMVQAYARSGTSRIAICSRSPATDAVASVLSTARAAGHADPEILTLAIDVEDYQTIAAAAKTVEEAWGSLDILVNNAGYMAEDVDKSIDEVDFAGYEKTVSVNVLGGLRMTRGFWGLVKKSELKIIVHQASLGAMAPGAGAESYLLSKFINIRVAEAHARQFENDNIITFSMHPGGIATLLANNLPRAYHGFLRDNVVLPADTLVWLTSKRREWINGRFIISNWDMEDLEKKADVIVEKDMLKLRLSGIGEI